MKFMNIYVFIHTLNFNFPFTHGWLHFLIISRNSCSPSGDGRAQHENLYVIFSCKLHHLRLGNFAMLRIQRDLPGTIELGQRDLKQNCQVAMHHCKWSQSWTPVSKQVRYIHIELFTSIICLDSHFLYQTLEQYYNVSSIYSSNFRISWILHWSVR